MNDSWSAWTTYIIQSEGTLLLASLCSFCFVDLQFAAHSCWIMLFYFILFYFGKPERSPHRNSHRSGVQSYCPTGFLAHHHCPHGGRISLTIHTMQQNSRCYFHPSIWRRLQIALNWELATYQSGVPDCVFLTQIRESACWKRYKPFSFSRR